MVDSLYKQERVFIATKHKKEEVIAPIFQRIFDARPFVSPSIDTDQFGTFTREIERKDSPLKTLRKKCDYGHKLSGCNLVIASEGSFGSHPSLPYTTANEEIVMFVDYKNDLEIVGKYLSTATNIFQEIITSPEQLNEVLDKIKFPSHGVILRDVKTDGVLLKDVDNLDTLSKKVNDYLKDGVELQVESDMRAANNPTRMKNIKAATKHLAENILSTCPSCDTPGFVITETRAGLPCSACGMPTRSISCQLKICQKCGHVEKIMHPNGKIEEDPMYCDFCNP